MEPIQPRTALERSPDFAGAERATLERLAARMVLRDYPAGTEIFSEGDPPGPGYLVQSGRVQLSSTRPDQRAQLLAIIGPGELLGEMTALLKRAHTATGTALEPVSAWEIPADALQAALQADARLAHTMLLAVMELLVDRDVRAVRRLGLPPIQQLATIILDLQRTERVAEGAPLPLRLADLEVLTGESQMACLMNLARLRRAGAVETSGEQLVVRSSERLRRLAE